MQDGEGRSARAKIGGLPMTYREQITAAMTALATDNRTRFIGYGLATGRAGGTLRDVPAEQIIETPVAENLMAGIAIGQSLAGNLPVLYFERFDFVLNAADALVNHLSAASEISRGQFSPAVIIRAVVGNRLKPLFTGKTHTQDLSHAFWKMLNFPLVRLNHDTNIVSVFDAARTAQLRGISTMTVEFKDML